MAIFAAFTANDTGSRDDIVVQGEIDEFGLFMFDFFDFSLLIQLVEESPFHQHRMGCHWVSKFVLLFKCL